MVSYFARTYLPPTNIGHREPSSLPALEKVVTRTVSSPSEAGRVFDVCISLQTLFHDNQDPSSNIFLWLK